MHMMNKAVLAFTAASLLLVGCAETRRTSGPAMSPDITAPSESPVPGAELPGAAPVPGPSLPQNLIGSLAGAYVSGEIVKSLDDRDRLSMEQSTQAALTSGQAGKVVRWANSQSGSSGTITPQPPYRDSKGRLCREYQETLKAKTLSKTGYRTACQEPDGSWRVVS
jgi:surface antigen